MTDLIACFTTDRRHRHLHRLINEAEWDRIFVVSTPEIKKKHSFSKEVIWIIVDPSKHVAEYIEDIKKQLKGYFLEVGINLVNGTGKDHMALLSAVMKAGLGFRLVAVTKNGVEEI
ncbi:hypothetical protein GOV08_00795 [Candidatus Woesearchaeota archaeon]|nr:hypothetical protein [Candidatus Woesearchaeota archaeon]